MKNSGVCPKCNLLDIIRIPGTVGAYGSGNNIAAGWNVVPVTRYLCSNCGYIEEWLDSNVNLQTVKRKFQYQKENGGSKPTNTAILFIGVIVISLLIAALAIGAFLLFLAY